MEYSAQQKKYIDSVEGKAHASAVEIIGLLDKTVKAQARLLISYRIGGQVPEWVFKTLDKAKEQGVDC